MGVIRAAHREVAATVSGQQRSEVDQDLDQERIAERRRQVLGSFAY